MDYLDQQAEKVRKKLKESEHELADKEKHFESDIAEVRALDKTLSAMGFKFIYVVIDEHDLTVTAAMFQLNLKNNNSGASINPKEPTEALYKELKTRGFASIKIPGNKGAQFTKDHITIDVKKESNFLNCKAIFY